VDTPGSGGYNVRREITDGNVYDYTFFIHVTPASSDGAGTTASFGPFELKKFPYCTNADVSPNHLYPNLSFEVGQDTGFTDVADQSFMSAIASC
jgi:hypothetical protein